MPATWQSAAGTSALRTSAAAALAAVLATVLAPLFPLHVEIPASAYLLLPVVTVVVGLLACSIALRRTARIDPATAFGG